MELEEAISKLEYELDKSKIVKKYQGKPKELFDDLDEYIKSIETVLNHLTKQEKMIELMALAISSYDGQLVINQYKDRNEVKAKFEEYVEDGTYEQYFEKKAEEIDNK